MALWGGHGTRSGTRGEAVTLAGNKSSPKMMALTPGSPQSTPIFSIKLRSVTSCPAPLVLISVGGLKSVGCRCYCTWTGCEERHRTGKMFWRKREGEGED